MSFNLLKFIFSIEKINKPNKLPFVVYTIFGIKFKFIRIKENDLRNIVKCSQVNRTIVNLLHLCLQNAKDDDLFFLRNDKISFVISKKVLNLDFEFYRRFINSPNNAIMELTILNKASSFYQEHMNGYKNNEFLWKYQDRGHIITKTALSYENNELYISTSCIEQSEKIKDTSKMHFSTKSVKRKYIEGEIVLKYILDYDFETRCKIIKRLLNYIFNELKDENNPKKVSGTYCDCHLGNFIVDKNEQFHFIDFDFECDESIDRNYCIYYMLYDYDKNIYKKMLEEFNFKDEHKYYKKLHSNYIRLKNKAKDKELKMLDDEFALVRSKYFG